MGGTYQQGWDDCLDAVLSILLQAKSLKEAKRKVQDVQVLIKAKKFEQIRTELGVLGGLF
jgi:type IV secretory pathway VirB4 component